VRLKFESSDGKTVVLKQSHAAKYALFFSEKYCLVNAHNLALLAKESYKPHADIEVKLSGLTLKGRYGQEGKTTPSPEPFLVPYLGKKENFAFGIQKIESPPSESAILDTQGFCYNDDTVNVFVFRGTAGSKDLAADGYAPKIEFLSGQVHKGFYDNFKAVKDQVKAFLDKPENARCKTILSGHSLGGALATLTAAYIASNYSGKQCGKVMVYTYGSPRVGDRDWVGHFNTKFKHFRHKRMGDPIPMLPPHHSSMRMPCLPVKITGQVVGAVGGAVIGTALQPLLGEKNGTFAGAEIGSKLVVMGGFAIGAGSSEFAFLHHGSGILLHQGPYGMGIVQTDLPSEIVPMEGSYFNSKEVLLAKEVVAIIYEFRTLIEPHEMKGYCAEIAHLLKKAILAYDKEPTSWLKMHQDISKNSQEAISLWKEARLRETSEFELKPVPQSTTSTYGSRRPILPEEKKSLYDDLINNAMAAKRNADNEISIWSQPGMKERLFNLIISGETSPATEKEIKFQETVKEPEVVKLNPMDFQRLPPI